MRSAVVFSRRSWERTRGGEDQRPLGVTLRWPSIWRTREWQSCCKIANFWRSFDKMRTSWRPWKEVRKWRNDFYFFLQIYRPVKNLGGLLYILFSCTSSNRYSHRGDLFVVGDCPFWNKEKSEFLWWWCLVHRRFLICIWILKVACMDDFKPWLLCRSEKKAWCIWDLWPGLELSSLDGKLFTG